MEKESGGSCVICGGRVPRRKKNPRQCGRGRPRPCCDKPECVDAYKKRRHLWKRPGDLELKRAIYGRIAQVDLAKRAGVSPSTLCRALNDTAYWPGDIPDFRERIEEVLKDEGIPINGIWRRIGDAALLEGKIMLNPGVMEFYGLRRDPFSEDIRGPEDIYLSREHKKLLKALVEGAEKQQFLAVIGQVGAGKSLIMKLAEIELRKKGNVKVCRPLTVNKRKLNSSSLLKSLILDLSTTRPRISEEEMARQLMRILEGYAVPRESGVMPQTVLLVLDEGHDYTLDLLRQLKRFRELTVVGFQPMLGIVLLGQTELEQLITGRKSYQIREAVYRLKVHYLKDMTGEAGKYLAHKFRRIGFEDIGRVFDAAALKEIQRLSGNPLIINRLAAASMNVAHEAGYEAVSSDIVSRSYKWLFRGEREISSTSPLPLSVNGEGGKKEAQHEGSKIAEAV